MTHPNGEFKSATGNIGLKFKKKIWNRNVYFPLASVAQWIERQPVNQRITGSIPSQGTCLGCRPGTQ